MNCKQGVQACILQIEPRDFYTPCSLNFVLSNTAKNWPLAVSLFGALQRIYTLCVLFTKRCAKLGGKAELPV